MNITAELLSSICCHITESFVMEILACSFAQKKFTKSLIERALGQPISEDAYIHLDDGAVIKMKHVFDYPYFKRAITKVTLSPPYIANLFSLLLIGLLLVLICLFPLRHIPRSLCFSFGLRGANKISLPQGQLGKSALSRLASLVFSFFKHIFVL